MKCNICDGKGKCERKNSYGNIYDVKCLSCKGTGKMPSERIHRRIGTALVAMSDIYAGDGSPFSDLCYKISGDLETLKGLVE